MKKTLVALAAMTAMCGASATSLTLYGVVDTGLAYNSIDWDGYKGLEGQGGDSFGMQSGQRSGSRWGMKGVEDLGNGLQVVALKGGIQPQFVGNLPGAAVRPHGRSHALAEAEVRIGPGAGGDARRMLGVTHSPEQRSRETLLVNRFLVEQNGGW